MSKRFRVISSDVESFHGCAPLGDELGRFRTKAEAEAFGAAQAGSSRVIIVATGVRALLEWLPV